MNLNGTHQSAVMIVHNASRIFSDQLAALRRNDPSIQCVDAVMNDGFEIVGYGFPLGHALLNNTVVNKVVLNRSKFCPATAANSLAEPEPMLRYLRTSSALRAVTLGKDFENDFRPSTLRLTGRLLAAAAENGGMTSVCLEIKVPVDMFILFLTSTAISDLTIEALAFVGFCDEEAQPNQVSRVATAMASNQTIQKLHLESNESTGSYVGQVLAHLDANSSLRELRVRLRSETVEHEMRGLAVLLGTTTSLQCLELVHAELVDESADPLFDGLNENSTVTLLRFTECYFHRETHRRLVDFVQNVANRDGNTVKELRISVESGLFPTFESEPVVQVIASMLNGSALESLELDARHGCNVADLLNDMAVQEAGIRIKRLVLDGHEFNIDDARALAGFVKNLSTLQELEVKCMGEGYDVGFLVAAFRENGSLLDVSLTCQSGAPRLDPAQNARFRTYCTRNARLPNLLATAGGSSAADDENDSDMAGLMTVPALVEVACHSPRTSPNSILRGLVGGPSEQVGPYTEANDP